MLDQFSRWPILLRWGVGFPLALLNGWLLMQLLDFLQPLPSLVGTAALFAFLLDIPLRALEKRRVPRGLALLVVLALVIGLGALGVRFALPRLLQELAVLEQNLPQWSDLTQAKLTALEAEWTASLPFSLAQVVTDAGERLAGALAEIGPRFGELVFSLFDRTLNLLLTVALTVFLVFYGEGICAGLLSWLSPLWQERLRHGLYPRFRAYLGGELLLGTILGANLSIAFSLLGVKLALLCGVGLGLCSLVPFADTIGVLVIVLATLPQDTTLAGEILGVSFLLGQLNDTVLEPKVIGHLIGLNPVWILLSVLLGLKLAGVLGVFLAVPLASFVKSLLDERRAATG